MAYWTSIYSGETWDKLLSMPDKFIGAPERRWSTMQRIKVGDIIFAYVTGISRYVAIMEVTGAPFKDDSIFGEGYPCCAPVKILLQLDLEHAVPVKQLQELSIFQTEGSNKSWPVHFRRSPVKEKEKDAQIIMRALENAAQNPVVRPIDPKKLYRKVYRTAEDVSVSIPEDENGDVEETASPESERTLSHTDIQGILLTMGQAMGLGLWVANNDKNKSFEGQHFSTFTNLRKEFPFRYDIASQRTIELIDVIWFEGNSICAAFEIEHTSSIYSGILRMADLMTMQPNIDIPLYIVAPDERQEKIVREINRPIFKQALRKPLAQICRYIPYSKLLSKFEIAREQGFLSHLTPSFLDEIAEEVDTDI